MEEYIKILQGSLQDVIFVQTSKKRLIVKTDIDRILVMKQISDIIPEFKRDLNISGSSIGGLSNGNISILVKPNTKVKGGGGRKFEDEFIEDFAMWVLDTSVVTTYSHLFDKICTENNITPEEISQFKAMPMGKMNQKRTLSSIIDGVTSDIGSTVTDVTLVKADGTKIFLSLKIGPSYYIYNGGFSKILNNDTERRDILSKYGINYKQFEEDFKISTSSSYFPKIVSNSEAIKNFENSISAALGFGFTIVHQNGNNSVVKNITTPEKIKISSIEYKPRGTSKFFAVSMIANILGKSYKVQFQLRNNAGKIAPNVFYFLIGDINNMSKEEKLRESFIEQNKTFRDYIEFSKL